MNMKNMDETDTYPSNTSLSTISSKQKYGSTTTMLSTLSTGTKKIVSAVDTDVLEERIQVPTTENYDFSFKRLWAFSGPGFLMSIAYLDPGNIEADLKAGIEAKYAIIWILFWATVAGLLIQRLAARIGAVTGEDLAETCRRRFSPVPRYILWIMLEITIIAADMQEVIGTAIALYLLTNKHLPLYGGVLITIIDTFTFLFLDKYGLRKLEAFFAFLISVMAITFGYEYFSILPEQGEIMKGLVIPGCGECNTKVFLQSIGTIGALITPHNLYLHSSLVKTRKVDRKNVAEVKDANRYYFIESAIALLVSLVINIFVLSIFAAGMSGKTNSYVTDLCTSKGINVSDIFKDDDAVIDGDIYRGGVFLGCAFGKLYMYIWAVGLIASGQSSTMTGTYTGQFVMEGFLNIKWKRWKRVLVTRTLAILPTIIVALFHNINSMSGMNDYINALMAVQLPFALLTTFMFTASKTLMKDFANDLKNNIFMGIMTTFLIGLNIYFAINFASVYLPHTWLVQVCVSLFFLFYAMVLGYLILCLLVVLGAKNLINIPLIGQYLAEKFENKENDKLAESKETVNDTNHIDSERN